MAIDFSSMSNLFKLPCKFKIYHVGSSFVFLKLMSCMILLKLFFFCSVVQWHPFIWTEHEKHETLEFTAFKNNLWKI